MNASELAQHIKDQAWALAGAACATEHVDYLAKERSALYASIDQLVALSARPALVGHVAAQPLSEVDERAAFEAWEQSDSNLSLARDPAFPDQYEDILVQCRWNAWQARAALSAGDVLTDAARDEWPCGCENGCESPDMCPVDGLPADELQRMNSQAAYEVLAELEEANDQLCDARTQEQYLRMLDLGQVELLERLDEARRAARDLLGRHAPHLLVDHSDRVRALVSSAPCQSSDETDNFTPPSHWDEWAMRKAREIVSQIEYVASPNPRHSALVHCALVEAMRYASDRALSSAAADVISERQRQMDVEGWSVEHDDKYTEGDLAQAAACYALHASGNASQDESSEYWPWAKTWFKPGTPRRDLVKAGALILAEIERLDRAALTQEGSTK